MFGVTVFVGTANPFHFSDTDETLISADAYAMRPIYFSFIKICVRLKISLPAVLSLNGQQNSIS
jgi:hypothetical protein